MLNKYKVRFNRLFEYIEKYIDPNPSLWTKIKVMLDFFWEKLIYKNELIEYMQYGFYFKTRAGRNKYLTLPKVVEIMKNCNNPDLRILFNNKGLFNEEYKEFLGRDFLDCSDSNIETIRDFFLNHDKVICKNSKGLYGIGVKVIDTNESELSDEFIQSLINDRVLIEEVLTQHQEFKEYNESSVNTIRVMTFLKANNEVDLVCSFIRLGRDGEHADNFHNHGIAAMVDIETGIIYTDGVDFDLKRYVKHPDSKKVIPGFTIPNWIEVKEFCKKLAMVNPTVRYVGWDICIKEDGSIAVIEGNYGAEADATQIPDKVGRWGLYKSNLDEIKKSKK